MNRAFFLYLWMRNRVLLWIMAGLWIVTIICAISFYDEPLALLGLCLVPLITIGLGAGATRSMWKMRWDALCRVHKFTTHNADEVLISDTSILSVQLFIRNYPWTTEHMEMSLDGSDRAIGLSWGDIYINQRGQGLSFGELPELNELKRICR